MRTRGARFVGEKAVAKVNNGGASDAMRPARMAASGVLGTRTGSWSARDRVNAGGGDTSNRSTVRAASESGALHLGGMPACARRREKKFLSGARKTMNLMAVRTD